MKHLAIKRRLLPVLLTSLAIAAHAGDDKSAAAAASGDGAQTDVLPRQALTPQILYQFLLAEIAGSRGQVGLSSEAYLDLARSTKDPRIARRAAEIALFAHRYDVALEAARLWSAAEPASPQARQMMTGLLAATNRTDELSAQLSRELAAAGPGVGVLLLQLNRVLGRYPDKTAAQQIVIRLTEPYLQVAEAYFARAQAAHNAGDTPATIQALDQALKLRPDWDQAALFRAQMTTDSTEAAQFLGRFVAANPKSSDARIGYARSLVSDKRYAEARHEFETLLADNPDNGDVIYAVGVLALQLHDVAAAERQFRRLVEMNYAEVNSARLYLGQIEEDRQHWSEAFDWYGAVTAGNQYLPARMRIANLLAKQKQLDGARKVLQESAASNAGERGQLVIAEAQLLREAGRHDEAYAVLAEALAENPDQTDLLYETALMAEKVGKADVSERNLRRLIELKPDYAHAYNALGYSLADRNERLDEAAALIDKALQLSPEDPFILDSKGWLLFRRGDADGALGLLRKAIALRADPEIAAHLGEVLWSMGRRDEATRTWDDAMKANPGNEMLVGTVRKFKP